MPTNEELKMRFLPLELSNPGEEDTEFIPLMTNEEEDAIHAKKIPDALPILPLRNTVLFPGVVIPITVGRDKSIRLIRDANKGDKLIGVVSQKDMSIEDPAISDLNRIGTMAQMLKMLRMPDGNTTVIIQGKRRFEIKNVVQSVPYFKCTVTPFDEKRPEKNDKEFTALMSALKDLSLQIINQSPNIPSEAAFAIRSIENPSFLVNFISSNMNADVNLKQRLLEIADLRERANLVLEHLTKELQMIELKNKIQTKVRSDIDKQQREYFLSQQLKTIQEELGGNTPEKEVTAMRERGKEKKWSKNVAEIFDKECDRLNRLNPASAEHSVLTSYLELLLDLPWNEFTNDNFNLRRAQNILDRDHYGLEKVKARILEYLAVLKLKRNM